MVRPHIANITATPGPRIDPPSPHVRPVSSSCSAIPRRRIVTAVLAVAFTASGAMKVIQSREKLLDRGYGWAEDFTRSQIRLTLLGSARARRERYVGQWVPEPLPETADWIGASERADTTDGDPADRITLDESVTVAFLVTLESMTPAERVGLILHDVFGFSFPEVGEIVGRTAGACRQLASSARQRARTHTTAPAPRSRQAGTVRAFKKAWESQNIDALLSLLDPNATAIADGGGVASAALSPAERTAGRTWRTPRRASAARKPVCCPRFRDWPG